MAPKPCLSCSRPFSGPGSRCTRCAPQRKTYREKVRRSRTVQAHREQHGNIYPGYERPPHRVDASNPLTADHTLAVAAGGDEHGPLGVLCRACNSAKRDRPAHG